MSVVSEEHKIAYFPIPKTACTSLKLAMFRLVNGKTLKNFSGFPKGKKVAIHNVYQSVWLEDNEKERLQTYHKFAVLRDPASRILSAYSDKVLQLDKLKGAGVPIFNPAGDKLSMRPSLDEFLLNLHSYRRANAPVRTHTLPVHYYLGTDLSWFDELYVIKDLARLQDDISARTNKKFNIPAANQSQSEFKVTLSDASPKAVDALMEYLDPEYDLLADHYSRP